MNAETYLASFIHKEMKKNANASKRIARRITANQTIRSIKEGPETNCIRKQSYAH